MSRYIDADALIERNKELADREFIHPKYQVTLREVIDDAPTVDAVPVVHGKWKIIGLLDSRTELYNCGACLKVWSVPRGKNPADFGYKFCPNCGAKMDEVTE